MLILLKQNMLSQFIYKLSVLFFLCFFLNNIYVTFFNIFLSYVSSTHKFFSNNV